MLNSGIRVLYRGNTPTCSSVVWQSTINAILWQYRPKSILDTSCEFPRLCTHNDYSWQTGATVTAFRSRREMEHISYLRRKGKETNFNLTHPAPSLFFETLNMSSHELEDMMSMGQQFDMVFVDRLPSHDIFPVLKVQGKMVVIEPVLRMTHRCLVESNNLFDIYNKIE